MKCFFPLLLVAALPLLIACGKKALPAPEISVIPTAAFQFKNADAAKLKSRIAESLSDLKAGRRPTQLEEVRNLYLSLDRGALDGEELVELKYLMTNFRAAFAYLRVKDVEKDPDSTKAAVEDLLLVAPYLDAAQSNTLLKAPLRNVVDQRNRERLIAQYADVSIAPGLVAGSRSLQVKALAGPTTLLPHTSPKFVDKYDNNLWMDDPTLGLDSSRYAMTGKYSAVVRGVEVRSGDIFLLDQGATAGINTSFSVPRSLAAHSGLVVFVEKNGKTFPAFFEIASRDLRVIPLNAAFGSAFNSTGEVYRVVGKPADPINDDFDTWAKALSDDVLARLTVKHYYDYNVPKIVTGEETGVVCSTQVQEYLFRAGIRIDWPLDKVDANAAKSLKSQFRYPLEDYVTPTSFVRVGKSQMKFVGAIEGAQNKMNTARELTVGSAGEVSPETLGYFFSHYQLDLKALAPADMKNKFFFYQLAVPGMMASGNIQVIAPAAILAFATLLDIPLGAVGKSLADNFTTEVYDYDSYVPFSLHDAAVNPEQIKRMKERNAMLRSWFK